MEHREFNSIEEIEKAIADGFKIKKLEFTIKNTKSATKLFDQTIRQFAVGTAQSNACMNQAYITLEDSEGEDPEILFAVFFLKDVVKIARKHMEEISKEINEADVKE